MDENKPYLHTLEIKFSHLTFSDITTNLRSWHYSSSVQSWRFRSHRGFNLGTNFQVFLLQNGVCVKEINLIQWNVYILIDWLIFLSSKTFYYLSFEKWPKGRIYYMEQLTGELNNQCKTRKFNCWSIDKTAMAIQSISFKYILLKRFLRLINSNQQTGDPTSFGSETVFSGRLFC